MTFVHSGPDISTDQSDDDENGPSRPPAGSGAGGSHSNHIQKKTPQQIANEGVLTRFLAEVEGVSFTFPEAVNVASIIRKTSKKQTTRFAGHIEIGSQLKIPCKIFTKVRDIIMMS